jgi:hypothetical protein
MKMSNLRAFDDLGFRRAIVDTGFSNVPTSLDELNNVVSSVSE